MGGQLRLNGWKSIARHLGRSERTIQSWESERALPVHRIPGVKGWTVYAYIEEVEAWMKGVERLSPTMAPVAEPAQSSPRPACKPGLLILPFEAPSVIVDRWRVDDFTLELIARFASLQPSLRVLSWTTSRQQRAGADSAQDLSLRLGVRYLIEGAVRDTLHCRRVDLRIVDAELDQVLLAHRFASSRLDDVSFRSLVVHGVVEHFDLVLLGALVEPLSPNEIDPECYIHYLEGVRYFAEGDRDGWWRACLALDRALVADSGFMPARALRALATLQAAMVGELSPSQALATARTVADACRLDRSARVTTAFLEAAIAVAFDVDPVRAESQLSRALLSMPPSVALRGRLYDRRSSRRDVVRSDQRVDPAGHEPDDRPPRGFAALEDLIRRQPQNLFANVMRAVAAAHRLERRAPRREATTASTG